MAHHHTKNTTSGFTLIELMVVISIISLLASIIFASLSTAREKARLAVAAQFQATLYHTVGFAPGAYWKFDEGSGSTALDSSGNGWTGNLTGATWVSGIGNTPTGQGSALSFLGTSGSYVDVPYTSTSDFGNITTPGSGGFTMAAWFKAASLPPSTNEGYIIFAPGFHEGLYMAKATGNFGAILWFSDNTPYNIDSGISINDSKWHYVAMSVNDPLSKWTIYLDGKAVGGGTYVKALKNYSGNTSYRIAGINSYDVAGIIDDPMIFNAPYQ